MKAKYDIHPDFKPLSAVRPPLDRRTIPFIQKAMGLLYHAQRSDRNVKAEKVRIRTGKRSGIRAILFTPRNTEPKGALLYCHGGGYAFPAAPYQYKLARIYAEKAGCIVLFPDYRLAPEHPFPAAPEDCFAAYRWLLRHAGEKPAAVCGDSAGGTLSLAVCLMAADRGIRRPDAALLTYPACGNCGETESLRLYTDTPMCNTRDAETYGEWYVPDEKAGKLAYRSPIEAESLEGIPATYIETAEFDCLRDGAVLFAEKLRDCGISVELVNTKGTVHGYDMMLGSSIVKSLIRKRIGFLRKAFRGGSAGA